MECPYVAKSQNFPGRSDMYLLLCVRLYGVSSLKLNMKMQVQRTAGHLSFLASKLTLFFQETS